MGLGLDFFLPNPLGFCPGRRPAFRRSSIVGFSRCQFFLLLSSFSGGEGAAAANPEAQDQFELELMSKPSNVMRNLPGTSRIEPKIKSYT